MKGTVKIPTGAGTRGHGAGIPTGSRRPRTSIGIRNGRRVIPRRRIKFLGLTDDEVRRRLEQCDPDTPEPARHTGYSPRETRRCLEAVRGKPLEGQINLDPLKKAVLDAFLDLPLRPRQTLPAGEAGRESSGAAVWLIERR